MAGVDFSEQPVRLLLRARGEEEGRIRAGRRAVAERDGPEAVDRKGLAAGAVQLAILLRLAVALRLLEIERVDMAVAKTPDEQVIAELTEVGRRNRQPPGGVEPPARGHATQQVAVQVERVDKAVPDTPDVVVRVFVLERVGHVDRAAQGADAERREPRRQRGVAESG